MSYPSNLYVYGVYPRVGVRWVVPIWVEKMRVPIKISGIAVPIKYFQLSKYFLTLGLTKTSFISNSLTERARQI